MHDLIIIGGGPAGLTAGIYAARAGLDVIVIEKGFAGGQASTTNLIENYPGFPEGMGGPELMMRFQEQAERWGCTFAYDEVRNVELSGEIKRAGDYEARAAIIAAGAVPRKLGVPGEEMYTGRGVSYCATCDGAFYKGREVAVIGGGDTAVEDVLYLSKFASKVYLIHRRNELRAKGKAAEKALENCEFMGGRIVSAFEREEGRIRIVFEGGESLMVDGAFIAAGTQPGTDIFRGKLDMDEGGYIIAGEDCKTSVDGVFCAGDCRKKPLRQVVTAASDGAVAASMAVKWLEG